MILAVATVANLAGLKAGARLQLTLAGAVAAALVVTVAISVPHMRVDNLTPFAPHGIAPIGSAVIVLFFAFAGWEAVGHLVGEFRDADRDVPKAVATTIIVVTVFYVGTAAAVVLTGTYGSPAVDRVAIGRLLQSSLGSNAGVAAALIAVIISLGTTNAFVAGVSRLGYSLGRDGWLPRPVGRVSASGIPRGGIVLVATIAYGGLGVAAVRGWGTETLVVVPSTLVVAVYLLAAAAAVKLLTGAGRVCAVLTVLLTLIVTPSAAGHALIPLIVAALALLAHALHHDPAPHEPAAAASTTPEPSARLPWRTNREPVAAMADPSAAVQRRPRSSCRSGCCCSTDPGRRSSCTGHSTVTTGSYTDTYHHPLTGAVAA